MRGIMQARQKPFEVIETENDKINTEIIKFYKPEKKEEIKMIDSENLDELIEILSKNAKVI